MVNILSIFIKNCKIQLFCYFNLQNFMILHFINASCLYIQAKYLDIVLLLIFLPFLQLMYANVVVTGGNSNIQGFTDRLTRDLQSKVPPVSRNPQNGCLIHQKLRFSFSNTISNLITFLYIIYVSSCVVFFSVRPPSFALRRIHLSNECVCVCVICCSRVCA